MGFNTTKTNLTPTKTQFDGKAKVVSPCERVGNKEFLCIKSAHERSVFKPLGVILSPAYPAAQHPIKSLVLSEVVHLAELPPQIKPTSDFGEPFLDLIIRPLLRSCYEKDESIRSLVLAALDKLGKANLVGELEDFIRATVKYFRTRFLDPDSAVSELSLLNQAARKCSVAHREFLLDLLLDKLCLEAEPKIHEDLLQEWIFVLEERWHPLTKEQIVSLFTTVSAKLSRASEASSASEYRAIESLVSSHKLSADMLNKLLRGIEANLRGPSRGQDLREFHLLNAELLRRVLPQLDSPAPASCDQEIVSIFAHTQEICLADFSSFIGFERAFSFAEVMIECIGLLTMARATPLSKPSEWSHALWADILTLMTWPFFLSKPNMIRSLNLATEKLWPSCSRMLLLLLSQSIMAFLHSYIHPRRMADLVGITNDIEVFSGTKDLIRRISSLHRFQDVEQKPLPQLLAAQAEKEVRRELRKLFQMISDYKIDDKSSSQSSSSSLLESGGSSNGSLEVANRASVALDVSSSNSSDSNDMPTKQQIQRSPEVVREFFQALNTLKAAIVSFLKSGVQIQRRTAREIEDIMVIFNDRMTSPAQLILLDMWNKVLSHLMLIFEDFSRGGLQAAADLALKEASSKQIQDLTSKVERASQQIADLQREKRELGEAVKGLKKENERIVETFSCAVCFENLLAQDPVCLDCGHLFCAPCVQGASKNPALGNRCPLCRQAYTKVIHIKGTQQ